MYDCETPFWERGELVAGTDEVGRGPLAGPVVCAAVVLDPAQPIKGLFDSKALSAARREALDTMIRTRAKAVSVAFVEPDEIDAINVLQASRRGMERALSSLCVPISHVLVDALTLTIDIPQTNLIKGDQRSASIAAASIVAKVARDRHMIALAERYPGYGFERHKGYPTKAHLEALDALGISPIHRRSFAPVAARCQTELSLEVGTHED